MQVSKLEEKQSGSYATCPSPFCVELLLASQEWLCGEERDKEEKQVSTHLATRLMPSGSEIERYVQPMFSLIRQDSGLLSCHWDLLCDWHVVT